MTSEVAEFEREHAHALCDGPRAQNEGGYPVGALVHWRQTSVLGGIQELSDCLTFDYQHILIKSVIVPPN